MNVLLVIVCKKQKKNPSQALWLLPGGGGVKVPGTFLIEIRTIFLTFVYLEKSNGNKTFEGSTLKHEAM